MKCRSVLAPLPQCSVCESVTQSPGTALRNVPLRPSLTGAAASCTHTNSKERLCSTRHSSCNTDNVLPPTVMKLAIEHNLLGVSDCEAIRRCLCLYIHPAVCHTYTVTCILRSQVIPHTANQSFYYTLILTSHLCASNEALKYHLSNSSKLFIAIVFPNLYYTIHYSSWSSTFSLHG